MISKNCGNCLVWIAGEANILVGTCGEIGVGKTKWNNTCPHHKDTEQNPENQEKDPILDNKITDPS